VQILCRSNFLSVTPAISIVTMLLLTCKHNFCTGTRCISSPILTNSNGSLVIAIKPEDTTVFRPAAVLLF